MIILQKHGNVGITLLRNTHMNRVLTGVFSQRAIQEMRILSFQMQDLIHTNTYSVDLCSAEQ